MSIKIITAFTILFLISWLKGYSQDVDAMSPQELNRTAIDYWDGKNGKTKDVLKALELFKLSAKNGDPTAFANIAYMYACGDLGQKDNMKALEWYIKGADELYGDFTNMKELAEIYQFGKLGTPINLNNALLYYKRILNIPRIKNTYRDSIGNGLVRTYTLKDGEVAPPNAKSVYADIQKKIAEIEKTVKK